MKISSTSGNHINSMDNKQDSISSYKTTILFYNLFQGKQTQEQIFCQGRIKWIPRTITRISKCLKMSYEQEESTQKQKPYCQKRFRRIIPGNKKYKRSWRKKMDKLGKIIGQYIQKKRSTFQTIGKFKRKSYKKITIQQIQDIQNNK